MLMGVELAHTRQKYHGRTELQSDLVAIVWKKRSRPWTSIKDARVTLSRSVPDNMNRIEH